MCNISKKSIMDGQFTVTVNMRSGNNLLFYGIIVFDISFQVPCKLLFSHPLTWESYKINLFPTYRHFLMPVHYDKWRNCSWWAIYIFLLLPQCLYLNSISVLIFDLMFTKSSAADLLYVGKGYLILSMKDII